MPVARKIEANVNKPLSLDAFVQTFYVKDAWTDEEG
jgi:hypothetical protein